MIKAMTKIGHGVGLHARPAAMVVKLVSSSGEKVTLSRLDQSPVNAASMLSVLSLGLKHGEEVEISIDSDGANELMDQIVSLISTPLDEY